MQSLFFLFLFLFLSSPALSFPLLPQPFFPFFLCRSLFLPSHTFPPFCLPLCPSSPLSSFSIPPSLCLCAQGNRLSLYHRVEPLNCSYFIHMETEASLLLLLSTHTPSVSCGMMPHHLLPSLSTCCLLLFAAQTHAVVRL